MPSWGRTKARCKHLSSKSHIPILPVLNLIAATLLLKRGTSSAACEELTRFHKRLIPTTSSSVLFSKTWAVFAEPTPLSTPKVCVHKPAFAQLGGEGSVWVCSGQRATSHTHGTSLSYTGMRPKGFVHLNTHEPSASIHSGMQTLSQIHS